jgi:hypothetical protein
MPLIQVGTQLNATTTVSGIAGSPSCAATPMAGNQPGFDMVICAQVAVMQDPTGRGHLGLLGIAFDPRKRARVRESIESGSKWTADDRHESPGVIYLWGDGCGADGSRQVAPVEGDHERASSSVVGRRRSGRYGVRRRDRGRAGDRPGDQHGA